MHSLGIKNSRKSNLKLINRSLDDKGYENHKDFLDNDNKSADNSYEKNEDISNMMNNLNIKESGQRENLNNVFGLNNMMNAFEGFNTNYDFEEVNNNNNLKTPNTFSDYYGNVGKEYGNEFSQRDKGFVNPNYQQNQQKE